MLPCFDLPHIKANFSISLQVPDGMVARSTAAQRKSEPGLDPGTTLYTFETTPKMSAYLIGGTVGSMVSTTAESSSGKSISVWSVPALADQHAVALQVWSTLLFSAICTQLCQANMLELAVLHLKDSQFTKYNRQHSTVQLSTYMYTAGHVMLWEGLCPLLEPSLSIRHVRVLVSKLLPCVIAERVKGGKLECRVVYSIVNTDM